jgi:Trypsin-co-occurring domain 1
MPDSTGQLRLIQLPRGDTIWARVTVDADTEEYIDTGVRDSAAAVVESVRETIESVVRTVADAVDRHRPDETTVEFGLEFAAKSGKVFAALGEVGAASSVKVSMTWRHEDVPAGSDD